MGGEAFNLKGGPASGATGCGNLPLEVPPFLRDLHWTNTEPKLAVRKHKDQVFQYNLIGYVIRVFCTYIITYIP